jgi:hypothetical protein
MKIRDYLKKVEIVNEIMALSSRDSYYEKEYKFYMEFDHYKTYSSKTYSEFKKLVKEEFITEFGNELLNREFGLNKEYIINDSFIKFSIE